MEFKVVALDGEVVQIAYYDSAEATLLALECIRLGFAHSKTGQILDATDLRRLCRPPTSAQKVGPGLTLAA